MDGRYDYTMGDRGVYFAAFLESEFNSFDNGYFPSRGFRMRGGVDWTFASSSRKSFFTSLAPRLSVSGVIPLAERWALQASFYGRALLFEEAPVVQANAMGGVLEGRYLDQQMPFYGINNVMAMNKVMTVYALQLRWNFFNKFHLTGAYNFAMDSPDMSTFFNGRHIHGAALALAYEMPVGPLHFDVHWSTEMGFGAYIGLGFHF